MQNKIQYKKLWNMAPKEVNLAEINHSTISSTMFCTLFNFEFLLLSSGFNRISFCSASVLLFGVAVWFCGTGVLLTMHNELIRQCIKVLVLSTIIPNQTVKSISKSKKLVSRFSYFYLAPKIQLPM